MKNKVYVVIAYRWGEQSNHSYLLGVYTKKHAALVAGDEHREYRGGKYECEVIEADVESKFTSKEGSRWSYVRQLGEVIWP